MMEYFKNKNSVVTASTMGLGYATAKMLLENGSNVIICSRKSENVKNAIESLKIYGNVFGKECDMTNIESVNEFTKFVREKFSVLHNLVIIPGDPKPGKFRELKFDDWLSATNLLLLSPVKMIYDLSEIFSEDASIVISTSIAIREPIPELALSNVVRLSLAGLVKTLSKELNGIRINGIIPGYFDTPRLRRIIELRKMEQGDSLRDMVKDIPAGRVGKPEEFANAVLFLLSPLSSYITGSMLTVDGGLAKSVF